jgi:integrase
MARLIGRLTELQVMRAKRGWHSDGGGLYLRVETKRGKDGKERKSQWWTFRYGAGGKRYHGLGPVHTISLATAREQARRCRQLLLEGVDPISAGKARRAAVTLAEASSKTFQWCTEQFHAAHCARWTNHKHAKEWLASMRAHVLPKIGSMAVADIDTAAVMRALEAPWRDVPETASRLRSRIESVLDWARVLNYRGGENPARWKGHLKNLLPTRKKRERARHHPALPYRDVPAFMLRLRRHDEIEAPALEYIILTCARASEVAGADWSEIEQTDLDGWTWIVPPGRIKGRREHRVPLSNAARAVLERTPRGERHGRIFPGITGHMVWKFLRALEGSATVHGFRSSFRDWAAEQTNFAREAAEIALAHRVGDETEEAYRRGDLLRKRRQLMEAWARYCESQPAEGKVVPIGGRIRG